MATLLAAHSGLLSAFFANLALCESHAASPPSKEQPRPAAALPKPGELVRLDFRPPAAEERSARDPAKPLRLVQWNIERGYQLAGIIEELRALQADVIALQEIDVHCERSGWEDTGRRIAEALQLNYVLVCEFEELHSPLRNKESQGGGIHGNAILSKHEFLECRAIEHR